MRLLGVGGNGVALSKIAAFAKSLEIFIKRLAALAPGDDMVDVQNDTLLHRRASATRSATKRITSKYTPSHPQVRVPRGRTGCGARSYRKVRCGIAVCVCHELLQRPAPAAESSLISAFEKVEKGFFISPLRGCRPRAVQTRSMFSNSSSSEISCRWLTSSPAARKAAFHDPKRVSKIRDAQRPWSGYSSYRTVAFPSRSATRRRSARRSGSEIPRFHGLSLKSFMAADGDA